MSSQPQNHVRILRRRNSLTQQDLAFLLGSKEKSKVCRYEQGHRIPSLRTAIALGTIFNTTVGMMFSNVQRGTRRDIVSRITRLQSTLKERYGDDKIPAAVSRELYWLEQCRVRLIRKQHQPA